MADYICPQSCSYRTNSGYCGLTGGYENCQRRLLYQSGSETVIRKPDASAGKWIVEAKQMIINLANAREQYKTLGYPHRNILLLKCSKCKMVTMVDETIKYDFCPHCGAKMEAAE